MSPSSPEATISSKEFSLSLMQPERISTCCNAITEFVASNIKTQKANGFLGAISVIQHPDIHKIKTSDAPACVWYEGESDEFTSAISNLMGNVDVPQNASYEAQNRADFERMYDQALARFASEFPATYQSFCSVINYVVFARRDGFSGGTVSNRIGLIWLAPTENWSSDEWLESLIHEFIHNVLFIEDMVTQIFLAGGSRLEEDDALAVSAIRQVKRGYDKSYHSAFVAFGIIEYYLALGNTKKARGFLDPLLVCLEDLNQNTKHISEYGRSLLHELIENTLRMHSSVPVH